MNNYEKFFKSLRDNLGVIAAGAVSVFVVIITIVFGVINNEQRGEQFPRNLSAISVNGITLYVELADDDVERERGLMHRTTMPGNQGMLFIFPDELSRTFWMKDTLIPLDIIYLDSNRKVVNIAKYTKPNQTSEVYPSGAAARYVVETNAGWSDQNRVEIGDIFENF